MGIWAKRWYAVTAALVLAHVIISSTLPGGYLLTVFGDVLQFLLLSLAVISVGQHIFGSQGRAKVFWILMTFGAFLWLLPQCWWVWYEVILRGQVPYPSPGAVVLFIHVVPIMGALALRPHTRQDERKLNVDSLDFILLLLWWVYMYLFVVMPWQFGPNYDDKVFGEHYIRLYFVENIVLVAWAGTLWARSRGEWKKIYGNVFAAVFLYSFSSLLVSRLIVSSRYHTGSIYDVPLVASICFFIGTGLLKGVPLATGDQEESAATTISELPAQLATLALISMPALALWALFFSAVPHDVTDFRVKVTLAAMLLLTVLGFLKQRLLNTELQRLLRDSQESFANLQRLQTQLVNTEKLAALGQLVAGAAHEINNPLTAIMGYSDLLSADPTMSGEPKAIADKIGQQARRTKRLVGNMLSFARQAPAAKTSVNVNTLITNVVQLREPDLSGRKIRMTANLDPELPHVWADSNHLLQVFLHMTNNAVDALQEVGGGIISINTARQNGMVVIEFSDTGPGVKDARKIFDPFYTTKPVGKGTGLGLSACYGIIKDHGGEVLCHNNIGGGACFVIKLPAEKAGRAEAASAPV